MKLLDGFILRPLGNDYIVMGETPERIDFSRVVSLNATAAYLWEQVQGREFTLEDLTEMLTARYDVDAQTARADAEKMLASWREAGVLEG
jgi:hypothetical protein